MVVLPTKQHPIHASGCKTLPLNHDLRCHYSQSKFWFMVQTLDCDCIITLDYFEQVFFLKQDLKRN